jgi:hypothetical protein
VSARVLALIPELASWLVPLERLEQQRKQDEERRRGSGIATLDELLGGGWPRGALSEIAGARSSGRTTVLLAALARALAAGEAAALVDAAGPGGALDPRAAAAAGVALPELLWIRCTPADALKATDLVVAAGGFGVVALDLCDAGTERGSAARRRVPDAAWIRLTHRAREQGTSVLVASGARRLGSFATMAVELGRTRPSFLQDGPALFAEVRANAALVRGGGPRNAANQTSHEHQHEPDEGRPKCVSLAFSCRS